jgi:hypothetical protein
MSKMWFDDSEARGCPKGWVWARNVDEAIEILKTGEVTECSLDHDMDEEVCPGYFSSPLTGSDLVRWMTKHLPPESWPHTIRIHSRNMGGGVDFMVGRLRDYKPSFTEIIVNLFTLEMIRELSQGEENGS